MKTGVIIEVICFFLILLFVYAAFSKLYNYSEFKGQLSRSAVIKNWADVLAVVLPVTELIIAGTLMVNITRRTGLVLSFILMILFTAYIIYMLGFEKDLPCSCGGVLKQLTWKQHLVLNIFFLLISFAGIKIIVVQQKRIATS